MFKFRSTVFVCALIVSSPCLADNVVDHNDVAGVSTLPQSVFDTIGQQTWFFTHASVGADMIGGLNALHTAEPAKYQLITSNVGYNSGSQTAAVISTTTPGTVYESDRGNPEAAAKFQIFDNSVRLAGWHDTRASIVMDKLCYIDQNANVNTYISSMSALESTFPGTTFVYTTMPLTTDSDAANVLRNIYNVAVRDFCQANDKFLFDIADIEAWSPLGNHQTFDFNGQTYDKLYSGFASDNGHLNGTGENQVALGWYAMGAQIMNPTPEFGGSVPEPATAVLLVPAALLLLRRRRTADQ